MSSVVVLNTTYEPLHRVTVPHAVGMLWRGVAVVVDPAPDQIEPEMFGPIPTPRVLLLNRYVKETWRYGRRETGKAKYLNGIKVTWERENPTATFTLENLLKRDGHTCAYCGHRNAATFDHVHPKSRGGPGEWLNALAACHDCNEFKADRTPEEAGLDPLWEPWAPTVQDILWGRTSLDRV